MEHLAGEESEPAGAVPPYVSHKTFINFVNAMRQGIPSRIDRSIMKSFSGAVQGQLLATLCYFELIHIDGTPKDSLATLVRAEGVERQKLLGDLIERAYRFVFTRSLDLRRITRKQIEEVFAEQHVEGETLRKAIGLFLALARDAEMKLSPHLTQRQTRPAISKRRVATTMEKNDIQNATSSQPEQPSVWSDLLLSKFPTFDPNWTEEVKIRWFDSFEQLMKRSEGRTGH